MNTAITHRVESRPQPVNLPLADYARYAAYITLPIIFLGFGIMKFTTYEAEGIQGLIANSPFMSFLLNIFTLQTVSNLIGMVEIAIALLIAARIFSPRLAMIGGLGAAATFVITTSFFISTPGVIDPTIGGLGITGSPGQFLLKDIGLFALSLFIAAEAAQAQRERAKG